MADMIKAYVKRILQYIELNEKNRKDLRQEFTTYLKERQHELQNEGLDQEQAAAAAIKSFGNEKEIGKELAKTMSPIRKIALSGLSLAGILLLILIPLFTELYSPAFVEPPYGWAVLMLVFSALWFLFYKRPYSIAKFRGWFIAGQIVYALLIGYGMFWTDGYQVYWPIILVNLLLLIQYMLLFLNIILGAILQPVHKRFAKQTKTHRTFSSIINLVSGILISIIFLIHALGYLFFASDLSYLIPFLGPVTLALLLWIITCIVSSKIPKLIPLTASIQALISIYAIYTFYAA